MRHIKLSACVAFILFLLLPYSVNAFSDSKSAYNLSPGYSGTCNFSGPDSINLGNEIIVYTSQSNLETPNYIPGYPAGGQEFGTIYWGDGKSNTVWDYTAPGMYSSPFPYPHDYAVAGSYTITFNIDAFQIINPATALIYTGSCGPLSGVVNVIGSGKPILGCTDPAATNYNSSATVDDGSCKYSSGGGSGICPRLRCVSESACQLVNDKCDAKGNAYPNQCSTASDCGTVYTSTPGCTDPTATNYNPSATINDGSCTYPPSGCNDNATASVISPIPSTLTPGQQVPFTIRVADTGNTRWYHGSYYQFLQRSGLSISPTYGHLPYGVYPGDSLNWGFTLTAPSAPGVYSLLMQMIHRAGADYIKANGTRCAPPASDTYFGQQSVQTFTVVPAQPLSYTLSVSKAGTGSGTVTSSPSGINCGSTCSANYNNGTNVTLTATPSAGSTFNAWGGACSGTGSCIVSMTAARSVTATFNISPPTTITADIKAKGPNETVPSDGPITIPYNTAATISWSSQNASNCHVTPAPWPGNWSGNTGSESTGNLTSSVTYTITCAGFKSKVGVTDSVEVIVTQVYTLTTSINSGSGTITGQGISCPGDCTETYPSSWVTLIATPSAGYTFGGWILGSSCYGQGSICSVFMNDNKTASVNFDVISPFNYSLSNSGTSNVTKTSGNAYTQNAIGKILSSGTTQPVTLSLSGVPNGTSYSIANGTCSPSCTSTITFTVTPSTIANTYPITVTGSPLNKQTTFNLVVSGNPITVSCSASPSTVLLGENVTWTANASGGTPPRRYLWSGTNFPTPAPTSTSFSITYSTIGQKTASVTITDADALQATCPASVVQVNFDPDFEEF